MPLYYRPWSLTPPPRPAPGGFESFLRGATLYKPAYEEEQEQPGFFTLGNVGYAAGEAAGTVALMGLMRAVGARLATTPHPVAAGTGAALIGLSALWSRLPVAARGAILGAHGFARYAPGQTPEERARAAAVGAGFGGGLPLALPALRSLRGRSLSPLREAVRMRRPPTPSVDRVVDETLEDLVGGRQGAPSPLAEGFEAMLQREQPTVLPSLTRTLRMPGAAAEPPGRLPSAVELPRDVRRFLRLTPEAPGGVPGVERGVDPYLEAWRGAVRAEGPGAVTLGPFEGLKRRPFYAGMRNPPADVARLRQWLRAANEGRGPLAGVPLEQQRALYESVFYKGQPLQQTMKAMNLGLAAQRAAPAQVDPVVAAVRETMVQPILSDPLVKHPRYPLLRNLVSKALEPDLTNPTLAASQADAVLAGLAVGRTQEQIAAGFKSLSKARSLARLDFATLTATIGRAFGVLPSIAGRGRKGVVLAAEQAAQAPRVVAQAQAEVMTVGQVLDQTDPESWIEVARRVGLKENSNSVLGLLALLSRRPELRDRPASMLSRLLGEIASTNPNPVVEILDRAGLDNYLMRLFAGRVTGEQLRGMPDDMLRTAARAAENLLSEGNSIARTSDITAMLLGAPSASRLLLLGAQGDVWKRAILTGDASPVLLRALEREVGRYGVGSKEIIQLAETIAANEGTNVSNALGYLAFRAGIPVENIEWGMEKQFLKLLQREAGGDPVVADFFRETELLQEIGALPKGFSLVGVHTTNPQIDDLVVRTGRMIEEQGLIEDPQTLLREITGVGQAAMQDPMKESIVARLEEVLNEMAYRRASVPERMRLVQQVRQLMDQPEAAMAILSRFGRRIR